MVLQHLADDHTSITSAARAHSRLHQAAVLALSSSFTAALNADVYDQEQLDSLLLYLQRNARHVNSINLTSDGQFEPGQHSGDQHDGEHIYNINRVVTLSQLPANLRLRSLKCSNLCLRLQPWDESSPGCDDSSLGFQNVLQAGAPLKKLQLSSCLLDGNRTGNTVDGAYAEDLLAAVLGRLPSLRHLRIKSCKAFVDGEPGVFHWSLEMFEKVPRLTHLELSGIHLHHWTLHHGVVSKPNLQALTRLVDLRIHARGNLIV